MARTVRKSGVKEVPLSEIKDDLSRYLREAETQDIVITRHGKPAGVLSDSNPKRIGSNTVWNMTPASCAVSMRRGRACAQGMGSGWRTLNRTNGGMRQQNRRATIFHPYIVVMGGRAFES